MVRLVAAETQLASDGPKALTESHTTEGMAKTRRREPPAVFAKVLLREVSVERLLVQCGHGTSLSLQIQETEAFHHKKGRSGFC